MKRLYYSLAILFLLSPFAIKAQTTVDLNVFLEGPFFTGTMTPWLNGWGYLPLEQPYDASPWYYYGFEEVTAIPNADVIDWVLVELRQTTSEAATAIADSAIARQTGFILKDGSIVGMDGSSPLQFSVAVTSNLYAVVRHRNHVYIMSGYPMQLSGGIYTYDFTTAADKAYGGVNGHKQIAAGVWGMVSGDGDSNGNVNNADKIDVWKPQSGNAGYLNGDFNMNGQVDNMDKNEFWKLNSGRSSQVPGGSANTPPVAVIQVNPPAGSTITIFILDALASHDNQSKLALLAVRWDFENDGTWDTPFSYTKIITHQYSTAGDFTIKVEVIDAGGLTDTETYNLHVAQAYGVPCPGIQTVTYEGQVYNTVQIGTQCWFKENLNVGTMINGNQNQVNNQVLEKYCYNSDSVNCTTYGGLYQWDEMMQYTNQSGGKGICPDGWHVPTDEEWCTLEQLADPTITCISTGWRGVDGGGKLKETGTIHWASPNTGATDSTGFSALPGGYRHTDGSFYDFSSHGRFWTSSIGVSSSWYRSLKYNTAQINRDINDESLGFYVRCLKNPAPPVWSCGDTIHDARDGRIYSTVEIGTQCWMQHNLNIGNVISGIHNQTNNNVIEKYCYDNVTTNCSMYGGLYQWDEMMQYSVTQGTKGICPSGWHLPTDDEWCILEQEVDPTVICKDDGWRGIDCGTKLKHGGSSGYEAMLAGRRLNTGSFDGVYFQTDFWTSTVYSGKAWRRDLRDINANIYRDKVYPSYGFSVRCVKDAIPFIWTCGDTIVDARDSQVYKTVQIGAQCWMEENLNIGVKIPGINAMTNNGIIEKYCYGDVVDSCEVYGGLYQWDEMMQYAISPGIKGICPSNWHLPTDDEWCTLEQYVDPAIVCDIPGWRGVDGGGKLKEAGTAHWTPPNTGATNSSGFTALAGGVRNNSTGVINGLFYYAYFWSSSVSGSNAWHRDLDYNNAQVFRQKNYRAFGFSVRCLRN